MIDQELRAVLLFDTMQQRDSEQRRARRYEIAMIVLLLCLVAVLGVFAWYVRQPAPINCPALALVERAA